MCVFHWPLKESDCVFWNFIYDNKLHKIQVWLSFIWIFVEWRIIRGAIWKNAIGQTDVICVYYRKAILSYMYLENALPWDSRLLIISGLDPGFDVWTEYR